jgi:hypothetical protein
MECKISNKITYACLYKNDIFNYIIPNSNNIIIYDIKKILFEDDKNCSKYITCVTLKGSNKKLHSYYYYNNNMNVVIVKKRTQSKIFYYK